MSKRRQAPPDQDALIPVASETPSPTADDLARAWASGYHVVRDRWPHPNVMKRVGRVCKNIAADCDTIDDWRDAWRAAHVAGKTGRWDITAVLIDELPRSLHVAPVRSTASDVIAAQLRETSIAGEIE